MLSKEKNPFKFLDPFNKEDRDYFFERDIEVKQLYNLVNKNRVVLVYGQLGTGKTSIIKCGLSNEFDVTDWKPFFIKREDNLNYSLFKALSTGISPPSDDDIKLLISTTLNNDGDNKKNEEEDPPRLEEKKWIASIVYFMQKVTEVFIRPIYLVFDQFEELLILANESEKKLFVLTLKTLLRSVSSFDCHVIIVMREEYFAWLDSFEKDIPGISDRRLRIEPMRPNSIKKVIFKSCNAFNITLAEPEKNVEQIVSAISKRGEIVLPYLQVYLDQLWRKDFERTFPSGYSGNQKFVPLTFTTQEIDEFGEIKDVLQRFLIEQREIFNERINKMFPGVDEHFWNKFLDCFINEQGTKVPLAYNVIEGGYFRFEGNCPKYLKDVDAELLKYTLNFFQSSQILRNNGATFELGHDILAKIIDKQRDAKQQRINGIRIMIGLHKKTGELIPYDLVKNWERYIDQIYLKDDEKRLFNESKKLGEEFENQQLFEKARKDAEKEEQIKRKGQRYKFLFFTSLIIITISIISFLLGNWRKLKIQDEEYAGVIMSKLDTMTNKEEALHLSYYIYDFLPNGNKKEEVGKRIVKNLQYQLELSIANLQLNSSSNLINGLDVDICKNGKYISVKNEGKNSSFQQDSVGSLFSVFNTITNSVVDSFKNVMYSYFLNHSDTLMLAFSDSLYPISNIFPYKFILYDCNSRHKDTFSLNSYSSRKNYLYSKEDLKQYIYSDLDSYKLRLMPSGKIVIPYFNLTDRINNNRRKNFARLLIKTGKKKILIDLANYTLSSSRDYNKLLYCYFTNSELTFEVFNNNNGTVQKPFIDAEYADFTANGNLIFKRKKLLGITNDRGNMIRNFTSKVLINKVYGGDEDYAFIQDAKQNTCLINFNNTNKVFCLKENLIGYDFKLRTFATQKTFELNSNTNSSNLLLRNFDGGIVNEKLIANGIESVEFNHNTNNILLKTKVLANSSNQLLYLFDSSLHIMGSFYLTPNDTYGFSNDGKKFFFVRDDKLVVFDKKKYHDVTNLSMFKTNLSKEKYDIGKLRKKYNIRDFPSRRFGL